MISVLSKHDLNIMSDLTLCTQTEQGHSSWVQDKGQRSTRRCGLECDLEIPYSLHVSD